MKALAVVTDGGRRLAMTVVERPAPGPDEVLVRVQASSLNAGEVRAAMTTMAAGARPGSDFAGTVEIAPVGSGFRPGDRVAGLVPSGAWAERVVVPARHLARLPANVTFEQAAALPVVGLTATFALEKAAILPSRKVLVTGASGALGRMTTQLAYAGGAEVTALVRCTGQVPGIEGLGAAHIVASLDEVERHGRYDLIIDAVGGDVLGAALGMLSSRGVCVLVGNAGGGRTTFDADRFRHGDGGVFGGTTLYGLYLLNELDQAPASGRLETLLKLVGTAALDAGIARTTPWEDADESARAFLAGGTAGKIVLTMGSAPAGRV